ncbi:MAG: DUF1493 family protein [Chitinophagaceae bacterium]|nr:DUF1493 family protein [Chitinophagaceae bacterium]MCW5926406.1 DUF1493 family protein [Chitinophagaceae bacterium]
MSDEIFDRILLFIERERWKYKKKLSRETTLERDLGITGDDADDFMDAFFKEFNVDISSFDISNYFSGEGFDPIGISRVILKLQGKKPPKKNLKDITLADLERAILAGKWIDPIEQEPQ